MDAAHPVSSVQGDEDLAAFLGSLQLSDSFFPSGLYTLSYGLETFAETEFVDSANLEGLLTSYLRHAVGPADGAALACAHRAAEAGQLQTAAEADLRLTAVKLSREARESSQRTGRQLLKMASQTFGGELLLAYAEQARRESLPANHAVALGLTTAALGIQCERAVAGELYAFTSSAVGASVRLSVIDHLFAQAVLHSLKPVIAEVARIHRNSGVRDIGSSAPMIDIMAMRHERAELRLFMS